MCRCHSHSRSPGQPVSAGMIRVPMKLSVPRAILYGGLTVGILDLLDAFVFFGLRTGARPTAILHSIAAGFVGRDAARAGGVSTAILGLVSHFLVATCIVTVYVLVSRVSPILRTRWVISGLVFGVAAYFVMTWFVVPMSNAGNGQITFALPATPLVINGILIHMFGVGLPAGAFASRILSAYGLANRRHRIHRRACPARDSHGVDRGASLPIDDAGVMD